MNKMEFPYIEKLLNNIQLREQFLKDYETGKVLICDPGKRSPFYFMASDSIIHEKKKQLKKNNFGISIWEHREMGSEIGSDKTIFHKIMNYTNNTRLKFTKRMKYGKFVEKWKMVKPIKGSDKTLKEIEAELSACNGKECNYDQFMLYIKKKLEYDNKVKIGYDQTYLQKLKWYAYLNKRKHENELLNHISNEFGNDIQIVMGDWSNKGQLRFISTPNIGLKRKLLERFKVYSLDEYNTSQYHYRYSMKCDNIYVKALENETKPIVNLSKSEENSTDLTVLEKTETKIYNKKLHSVLTYKFVKPDSECKIIESGCINRDKNSVMNMETIMKELLKSGKRPAIFDRSTNQSVLRKKRGTCIDAGGTNRENLLEKVKPVSKPQIIKSKNVKSKNVKSKIIAPKIVKSKITRLKKLIHKHVIIKKESQTIN